MMMLGFIVLCLVVLVGIWGFINLYLNERKICDEMNNESNYCECKRTPTNNSKSTTTTSNNSKRTHLSGYVPTVYDDCDLDDTMIIPNNLINQHLILDSLNHSHDSSNNNEPVESLPAEAYEHHSSHSSYDDHHSSSSDSSYDSSSKEELSQIKNNLKEFEENFYKFTII